MNEISNIYLNLIKNPFIPKIYRELRDYYKSIGMDNESNAFVYLLKIKYNEIYDTNIDHTTE